MLGKRKRATGGKSKPKTCQARKARHSNRTEETKEQKVEQFRYLPRINRIGQATGWVRGGENEKKEHKRRMFRIKRGKKTKEE